ncbi:hypothetical protein QBC47DRAFT_23393 [Echria macrotheca]|uniref:Uncharacterized protein n=1 Tax=Echria macrotheca TaxID=438768 RepID=A0AAJ0BPU2_9PEZI|nr:hypothetical protein QBC47DRAFT_23393 [Echria macrotheca]
MKETMDGAVESRLDKVVQHVLPARPHHLALSLDRRFPRPAGYWFTDLSAPLQFLTYTSDADRGILITRPSYDICEDAGGAAVPMPIKVLAKGEVKKKLSIKDYQKKKNSSASPTENDSSVKVNGTTNHLKAPKEEPKKPIGKPEPVAEINKETPRPDKPRSEINGERNGLPSSKPQYNAESRKLKGDADGELPPAKRLKTESGSRPETGRSIKPGTPLAKDRLPRDSRDEPRPKPNGLAPPAIDQDRENTASPRSTIQVNGTRPHPNSGRSTPRKPETSKATVPALLSPLRPELVEKLGELEAEEPLRIPPLLSPTLPPVVEAELARIKPVLKNDGGQKSTPPESPSSGRKKAAVQQADNEEESPARPSRIVTIKLKKATAKRAKELLSLPSKSAKEAMRKELPRSVEHTPPPPARKRPRLADDPAPEGSASKRPRMTADTVVARPTPSTPLKQGATAMSRVTSSQSHGTPGNSTGLTPGALDRPPTRSDSVEPGRSLAAGDDSAFREKHREWEKNREYQAVGVQLKRQRDGILRSPSYSAADEGRVAALHVEMVLAYMIAYSALDRVRTADRKMLDFQKWTELLPHVHELRKRVQSNRVLLVLALQMNAVLLEQATAAFQSLDPANGANMFARWAKLERARMPLWVDVMRESEAVEDRKMKMVVGPWTRVEDMAGAALGILRRWADREGVRWQAVIMKDRVRDKDRDRDKVNGVGT